MNYGYLLVSLAYMAFVIAVYLFESHRTRRQGVDTISLFLALFVLQCCATGVVIYALWPYVDSETATGVPAFDRILRATDVVTTLLILFLTVWFAIFFYVGCAFGRMILPRPVSEPRDYNVIVMVVKQKRLLVMLAGGLTLTLYSFLQLGDNLLASYTHLIMYRDLAEDIERTALNANAFALTQTWSWLTVVAIFCVFERRGWCWLLPVCLAAAVVFALLGVSRRALFLPVLMIYLTLALHSGRWRVRWIVVGTVPLVFLVAFGKNILAAVAYDVTVETIVESYESWMSALLRVATDIGITIVESLGTLQFLDIGLRLGIDHFLSMLQRFPEKSLGLDFDFPERIVRISTTAFADADSQDIPPGLLGQMWLDFGVAGPVIWGLAFGLQMSVIQFFFERTRRTRQSAVVFMLLVFIVALPLNSGSLDFTFSVDIIALVAVLLWCVRFRRQQTPQGHSAAKTRTHLTSGH